MQEPGSDSKFRAITKSTALQVPLATVGTACLVLALWCWRMLDASETRIQKVEHTAEQTLKQLEHHQKIIEVHASLLADGRISQARMQSTLESIQANINQLRADIQSAMRGE